MKPNYKFFCGFMIACATFLNFAAQPTMLLAWKAVLDFGGWFVVTYLLFNVQESETRQGYTSRAILTQVMIAGLALYLLGNVAYWTYDVFRVHIFSQASAFEFFFFINGGFAFMAGHSWYEHMKRERKNNAPAPTEAVQAS